MLTKYGGVALLMVSASLWAAPPYEFHGLHIDRVFTDAVALAEELGGDCQLGTHRRGEVTFARCSYSACNGVAPDEACASEDAAVLTLELGPVRVESIRLESFAPDARLTQAAIIFQGDADAVARGLEREFGPPADSTGSRAGDSWSNSRRLFWRDGEVNMSLLKNRRTIMLTTHREAEPARQPGS